MIWKKGAAIAGCTLIVILIFLLSYQSTPCAIIALATFMKPATLAPFT